MYRTGREFLCGKRLGGGKAFIQGHIFFRESVYRIIPANAPTDVGALTDNHEWAYLSLLSRADGKDVLAEFDHLWFSDRTCSFDEFIDEYETAYEIARQQRKDCSESKYGFVGSKLARPNAMQRPDSCIT